LFLMTLGAIKPFLAARSSDGDLCIEDVLAVKYLAPNKDWRACDAPHPG